MQLHASIARTMQERFGAADTWLAQPVPKPFSLQIYIYRWDRQGRKGQTCRVTARGKFNSIRVVFEDGYEMITSGNAIRRACGLTPA